MAPKSKRDERAWHSTLFDTAIARVSDAFIHDVNEAFANVTGYKREEVIGRRSRDIPWWPSEEAGENVLGKMRDDGYLEEFEMRVLSPAVRRSVLPASRSQMYM